MLLIGILVIFCSLHGSSDLQEGRVKDALTSFMLIVKIYLLFNWSRSLNPHGDLDWSSSKSWFIEGIIGVGFLLWIVGEWILYLFAFNRPLVIRVKGVLLYEMDARTPVSVYSQQWEFLFSFQRWFCDLGRRLKSGSGLMWCLSSGGGLTLPRSNFPGLI